MACQSTRGPEHGGHYRTGSEVAKHEVGDRVGVGCESNSCGECVQCARGEEVYCEQGSVQTYAGVDSDGTITQGGHSQAIVVDERFRCSGSVADTAP